MTDAIVFDLYGTLLDVSSLGEACREVTGTPVRLVDLWRQKQLEYTWLRSVMGEHKDFWKVTVDALDYAMGKLRLTADIPTQARLLNAWLTLSPHPEVVETLKGLAPRRLAVLSNGSPEMLAAAIASAGLQKLIDPVLSVEQVGVYKPHPSVYALAPEALGVDKERILFVSSNAWDAAGAKAFGFQVAWVNRSWAEFEVLGHRPDIQVTNLAELAAIIKGEKPGQEP